MRWSSAPLLVDKGICMKVMTFGVRYVMRHHLLKKQDPLICGLVLTNKCNLQCRHCRVTTRDTKRLSFGTVQRVLDSYHQRGGRCLYLEGGEPFLWRDGSLGLEHVVEYAHRVGYFTVVVYTNGTIPIQTTADTVFVSVDGLQETHDYLRGVSFAKIMDNIRVTSHRSLFVNFTINARNKDELEEFCAYVSGFPRIKGTFFYFHTPYYGRDDLYVEPDERNVILRRLLAYKKRYRILNSRAGLKSALRNDWRRPLPTCSVFEDGETYVCCRFSGDPELCRQCGYLSYAEIDQTLKLKPSAIFNALKYF
jgi:MoaA/NifB/PqqE/SkfB family radical SAM enzyme